MNLSILEKSFPGFRSDELYFIRLAGAYIQSIFWDVFNNSSDAGKKRRARMLALAQEQIKEGNAGHLRKALFDPEVRKRETMDCLSGHFKRFLKSFDETQSKQKNSNGDHVPDGLRNVFRARLREHHAIFVNFDQFLGDILQQLMGKRHFLEHYEDEEIQKKIRKGNKLPFEDEKVMEALGLLLPPMFLNMFLGRMAHWKKLCGPETAREVEEVRKSVAALFDRCKKERRENTKRLFAQELTREKIRDKNRRKSLVSVSPGQEWRSAYAAMTTRKDDYRLHEFKMRYYFIGQQNIRRIQRELGGGRADFVPDFKRGVEVIYLLTARINLQIHLYLGLLPTVGEKREGSKELKQVIIGVDEQETQNLKTIRDMIAHNHMFWAIPDMEVEEVFRVLMGAVLRACGRGGLDSFHDRVVALCRRENYAIVDRRDDAGQQPKPIRRWTKENREKYQKGDFELDMRRPVRRVVGRWVRALDRVYQDIGKAERLKKKGVSLETEAKKCKNSCA